jgi:hypothetical protein
MRSCTALFLSCLVAAASPAASAQPFLLAQDATLRITLLKGDGKPKTWTLESSSPQWKKLAAWLSSNGEGWSRYRVTVPGSGLLVDTPEWRLQFVGDGVIACKRREQCVTKTVQPSEYEFLASSEPK